jgi:hypothetical protein
MAAHEKGLNISQICEQTLKTAVQKGGNLRTVGSGWWTGGDLNPRPPECKRKTYGSSDSLIEIEWEEFKQYLIKGHTQRNALDLWRTAKKHYEILWQPSKASSLFNLSDDNRRLVMASLANLSKFLGVYKMWKEIVENAGLKWSSGNSEEVIIKRFTKAKDPNDLVNWVKTVKTAQPELSAFMDFICYTGIRFIEAVDSYNLIIELNRTGRLQEYCNGDMLEHYKFRDLFIRRSKKVFISFVPKDLVDAVGASKKLSKNAIINRIKRLKLISRFGDIREYWASIMTRQLSEPEINFLQGRVSTSIFMKNYFNPAWISDLKPRALKGADNIRTQVAS